MSIAFQSFSWWTLFGSLSLALIYSWVLYKPEKKISMGWKWALATLRFSSSFLLAVLLLSPVLNDIDLSYEKPILFIVQDNSSSIIANGKANYYKSDFLADRNESIEKLKEKFDLKNIRVGSALMYNGGIDYTDSKSHLSAIYQELESAYANRNVAAIVIATDGISNEGLEIESAASRVNIPSYFVMMGDSVRRIDLRIHELQHNDLVYANNDFLVQMKVKAFGLKGKDSKAIIRDAEKNVIWQEEIKIQSNDELISLSAALPAPTSKGLTKYSLQLLPAGTEQNTNNNSADFYVELQDQKQKIGILFSNAHPDISALKQSLENLEGYELRLLPLEELGPEQYVDLQLAILH